jgi:ABC-type sugar transport system ATPase subunit
LAKVELTRLCKRFGNTDALTDVSLTVADREFVVLVGPSGCGKSTLLRMVAGLEQETHGAILFDGRPVTRLSPGQRNVAMVFQNYALYPHLSVGANIGFGLRRAKLPRAEKQARVLDVARLLELEDLLDRRPSALSGGQRQRVAMGRAIIRNPSVFLFDEPLSNLDARLRMQMRREIRALHAKLPTTTLYVTHDQTEAMTMGDRVVVMNKGRIEQVGTPDEIYNRPRSRFVAEFIGMPGMNILPMHVSDRALHLGGQAWSLPHGAKLPMGEVIVGLRPEHLRLSDGPHGLPALLDQVEPMGSETLLYLHHEGHKLCARVGPDCALLPGARVMLDLMLERATLFDTGSGAALWHPQALSGETT